MKTKKIFKTICLSLLFLTIFSCSKDDDNSNSNIPQQAAGFYWKENATNATENQAGSSEFRTQYNSIFAFVGSDASSGTLFEINLTNLTPGTYTIGSSNFFYFNGNTNSPDSGEVIITSNANGKASGTFEAHYSSGTITSVYGRFTEITVQ